MTDDDDSWLPLQVPTLVVVWWQKTNNGLIRERLTTIVLNPETRLNLFIHYVKKWLLYSYSLTLTNASNVSPIHSLTLMTVNIIQHYCPVKIDWLNLSKNGSCQDLLNYISMSIYFVWVWSVLRCRTSWYHFVSLVRLALDSFPVL